MGDAASFTTLDQVRRGGVIALVGVTWIMIVTIGAGCALSGRGWTPLVMALVLGALPTLAGITARDAAGTRIMLGATVPLFPAVLLFQWSGTAWQIDIHMLFFALLATLAAVADWRAIVAGTLVTAVHHLGTNLLLPSVVFPDGADITRVLLHAVIVLVEAGVLIQLVVKLERMIAGQTAAREEARRAEAAAAALREQVAAEQALVITAIGDGLTALSHGDLTHRIAGAFPAEYARLQHDFNQAIGALGGTLTAVSLASASILDGAGDLSQASEDLSQRTERQAASLEQTAATLTQITDTVRRTAADATRADALVDGAKTKTDDGAQVVRSAMQAMDAIATASREINDIVAVIDGISFQTNLLALNAGVEAARAGDAGKGFAVVAEEVRALAQRSAEAARDIKTRIEASAREVSAGVAHVHASGAAFDVISGEIGTIRTLVSSIATLSGQQANSLREVNTAVGDMDQVTQQNAAMVEQSTAATRRLAGDAHDLATRVAGFTIGEPADRSAGRHQAMGALAA